MPTSMFNGLFGSIFTENYETQESDRGNIIISVPQYNALLQSLRQDLTKINTAPKSTRVFKSDIEYYSWLAGDRK